jgi:hypothetical protein
MGPLTNFLRWGEDFFRWHDDTIVRPYKNIVFRLDDSDLRCGERRGVDEILSEILSPPDSRPSPLLWPFKSMKHAYICKFERAEVATQRDFISRPRPPTFGEWLPSFWKHL